MFYITKSLFPQLRRTQPHVVDFVSCFVSFIWVCAMPPHLEAGNSALWKAQISGCWILLIFPHSKTGGTNCASNVSMVNNSPNRKWLLYTMQFWVIGHHHYLLSWSKPTNGIYRIRAMKLVPQCNMYWISLDMAFLGLETAYGISRASKACLYWQNDIRFQFTVLIPVHLPSPSPSPSTPPFPRTHIFPFGSSFYS